MQTDANQWRSLAIPDDRVIADLWVARWTVATMTAACEVGLLDRLGGGAAALAPLAAEAGLHEASVESALRVLAALGFVRENARMFTLTELARAYLLASSPLSRTAEFAEHRGAFEHDFIVRRLKDRGRKPRSFVEAWREIAAQEGELSGFLAGMDSLIKAPSIAAARSGAFAGVRRLLDVGGGAGTFCTALTAHEPAIETVVLDQPAVCAEAAKLAASRGAKRITFHPADFFSDAWAPGCDATFFSNVLHNWGVPEVHKLLTSARAAVPDGDGRLFVLEALLDDDRCGPVMPAVFHLQMQMSFDAGQYTQPELARFAAATGWSTPRVAARFGYYVLLVCDAA